MGYWGKLPPLPVCPGLHVPAECPHPWEVPSQGHQNSWPPAHRSPDLSQCSVPLKMPVYTKSAMQNVGVISDAAVPSTSVFGSLMGGKQWGQGVLGSPLHKQGGFHEKGDAQGPMSHPTLKFFSTNKTKSCSLHLPNNYPCITKKNLLHFD